LHLPYAN
jgi:hypothetical protein